MDAAYVEFPEPVAVDDIIVHEGREELDEQVIAELVDALRTSAGFLNPILVRWVEGEGPVLVDGLNRLTAAKRLGWRAVPVAQVGFDSDDAALVAEFQANNIRRHYDVATLTRRSNQLSAVLAKVRAGTRRPTQQRLGSEKSETPRLSAASRPTANRIRGRWQR